MTQLTKDFTLEELTRSETAETAGIGNEPNEEQRRNLKLLAGVLQQIRDRAGVPVAVSSGFRGAALNKRIGGSKTSLHCAGLAADIPLRFIDLVREMQLHGEFRPYGIELIRENTVCHVGINLDGRDEYIRDGGFYQKQ
jgi:uncharacterized protein YcbK (DUF882 family)